MPRANPRGGPGSVYQRKDGYWCASVSLGGKRIVRYAPRRREARASLQEMVKAYHLGKLAPPTRITLATWMEQWLEQVEATLRPSTHRTYCQVLGPVVAPIGHMRLDRLTPAVLADTFTKAQRSGMGARRLQLAHGYLKACLDRALDMEILGSNPMAKVPRPKWQPKERRYWSVEEASHFIVTAQEGSRKWAPLFVVLTTTGLRISEALGLRWSDVDLRGRTLRVERALVWAGKEHVLGPVKTRAAQREVSLPDVAVEAFQRLPRPLDPDQPIFRTSTGRPPRPDHLREPMADLCREARVSVVNIHGLRHTATMLALKAVRDPHMVQRRLGHSNVNVTMGVYGYAAGLDGDIAEALGRLLKAKR